MGNAIRSAALVDGSQLVTGAQVIGGTQIIGHNPVSGLGDARQGLVVPLYEYPTYFDASGDFQTVQAGGPYASMLILNDNGPPAPMNVDWANQTLQLQASGVRVLGYVATDAGATPIATVQAQISQWYSEFAGQQGHNGVTASIDGIFLDQANYLLSGQPYFQQLYNYIKGQSLGGTGLNLVVLNPGVIPDESYMACSDVICVHENTYTYYTTSFQATIPVWFPYYSANRYLHIVEDVTTSAELATAVALSKTLRGGYFYAIDSAGGYTTLVGNATSQPQLWTQQVAWCQYGITP